MTRPHLHHALCIVLVVLFCLLVRGAYWIGRATEPKEKKT